MDNSNVTYLSREEESTADSSLPYLTQDSDTDRGPKRATAAMFKSLSPKRTENRFNYRLSRMSLMQGEDVVVEVMLPNFADRAMINELPRKLQKLSADLMFSNSSSTPGRFNPLDNMERTTKRGKEVANLYFVVGAVNPKFVLTEEEEANGEGIWVERVPFDDRWDFVRISDGNDDLASRRISRFLDE